MLAGVWVIYNTTFPSFVVSAPSWERFSTLHLTDIYQLQATAFSPGSVPFILLHFFYTLPLTLYSVSSLLQLQIDSASLYTCCYVVPCAARFERTSSSVSAGWMVKLPLKATANANLDDQQPWVQVLSLVRVALLTAAVCCSPQHGQTSSSPESDSSRWKG